MKIIALEAENLKRLTAVRIEPDGNLVQITGKNGQGKTSVLDAIWWALAGTSNVQTTPIRKGEDQAIINLDLGDLKVRRKFIAQEDGSYTTSITVENGEGARFQSPQKMLDALVGQLSFDPLAFSRMKSADKVQALRSLVPDYDFDAAAAAHKEDFDERTIQNRKAKEAQAAAEAAGRDLPDQIPEPVDTAAEMQALEAGIAHNERQADLARQRDATAGQVETLMRQITELKSQLTTAEARLEEMPEPEDEIDLAPIRDKIASAKEANAVVQRAAQRDQHAAQAKAAREASEALTQRISDRKQAAQDAIANADLPVKGIEIIDGEVLLNGVPFEQASDAEQLSASIGIAMTLNPDLKVIRVRDGSLLDEDAMKVLASMADEADYQIWIERVDSSGSVGFVLEDGHLKGQEPE